MRISEIAAGAMGAAGIGAALIGGMLVQSCQVSAHVASAGDSVRGIPVPQGEGSDRMPVYELFTRDGCTVFRFADSAGTHYLAARSYWSHYSVTPCALGR